MTYSVTKAIIDIERIKRNQPNFDIEFYDEESFVKTQKNYLFLGKTHEYIFIYDLENCYTEIYKIKDIKCIRIKKSVPNKYLAKEWSNG